MPMSNGNSLRAVGKKCGVYSNPYRRFMGPLRIALSPPRWYRQSKPQYFLAQQPSGLRSAHLSLQGVSLWRVQTGEAPWNP